MKLDEFLEMLEELKEMQNLLNTVYSEIGPYNNGQISTKTLIRLHKHFNFDDSE